MSFQVFDALPAFYENAGVLAAEFLNGEAGIEIAGEIVADATCFGSDIGEIVFYGGDKFVAASGLEDAGCDYKDHENLLEK